MTASQKWLVWISSALTGMTGLAYWWMKNRMQPVDEFSVINHPLEPWVLKAHILVAPIMVFAIGVIAGEHIWRQYKLGVRAGRRSGLMSMWVLAPMILSGYAIQVVTHVGWLEALAWSHLVTGVLYLLGVALHHPVLRQAGASRARGRNGAEREEPAAADTGGSSPRAGERRSPVAAATSRAAPRPSRRA